jgi:DNA end-binding protein Ku
MATQLVESLARPFEPKEFENEHKRELLALIERKLSGEEVPVAAEPAPAEPVPDLMAALKASIDQAKGDTEPPKSGGRAKSGSGGGAKKSASANGAPAKGRAKKPAAASKSR